MRPRRDARLLLACSVLALPACGDASPPREPPGATAAGRASAPIPPPTEAGPGSALDTLMALGDSAYWAGDYEAARATWARALTAARARADTVAEADVLTWSGLAAWRLGDYAAARREGEAALQLKLKAGLAAELSRSYNALGLLAWNEGRLPDAAALFEQAASTARAVADDEGAAKAIGNMALVRTELGDFGRARGDFIAALDAGRRLGNERIEANSLTNLAMLDLRVGSPLSAVGLLQQARQLYRSIDYATGEQTALAQLGAAYAALGEPGRSFAALDGALSLARRHGLRQDEAANLELLAFHYRQGGELRRALEFYRQARELDVALGLQLETGNVLRNEAEIQAALGDLDVASRDALSALRIHRDVGAAYEELKDLLLLAELASRAAPAGEAASHLRDARALTRRVDSRVARMQLALTEARIAERADDPAGVIAALGAAGPDLERGGYGTEWEVAALRARGYAALGMLDSAAAAARRAVWSVERVRGNFGSGLLRSAYADERARVYADAVDVLLRLGARAEALEIADAARGRALLEHLAIAERGDPRGAAHMMAEGEILLRTADELAIRLDSLERSSAEARTAAETALSERLFTALTRARSDYEALLLRVAELDRGAATLLGAGAANAAGIRAALDPGEILLEYLVTPDRLLLFVVSAAGVRVFATPVESEALAARVRIARDQAARPSGDGRPELAVLDALHELLVGPALRAGALRGARRLVIVPHAMLGYLPFAALRDPDTGRYLVEDYALLHLPSASALPVLRAGRRGNGEGRPRATVLAPFLEQLPATRREARVIRTSWPRATLRVGRSASEGELRRALARPGIVHVASHGIMNARNPMFSRMELVRGSGAPADDGRLEVHEILALRTATPLVFLSGCETGAGAGWSTRFARNDDYATLAQAFLYAGADNVVATLWPIRDESAAELTSRFYRHLRWLGPAEALARAQRDLAANPRFRAPYHWAAYQVRGDGRPPGAQSVKTRSVP